MPLDFDTPLHFMHLALAPGQTLPPDLLTSWCGGALRADLWRRHCAKGSGDKSCAARAVAPIAPTCARHPDGCLAHALIPLSGQSNRHAWLSPALHLKPDLSAAETAGILLSLAGHFPSMRRESVAEAVLSLTMEQAARAGLSLVLRREQLTTLPQRAAQLAHARRWRIEFLTPWVVEKTSTPSMSLASRANAIALTMAQRVRRYTAMHLWSLRRAGLRAVDGVEAHELALAVEAAALEDLGRLRCVDADLLAESVVARPGEVPRQQIRGWLELALPKDADTAQMPVWLAMVDVIGLGQGTAKASGAVRISAL